MRSIARFFRVTAIIVASVAALPLGIYLYLLSQGLLEKRSLSYGFKIAARVSIGGTTYFGEAHTRCTAHQSFPHFVIAYDQQGQTLAIRLDQGRVLFVKYTNFHRWCHPIDPLWGSATVAPWRQFTDAVADAMRSQRQLPIDPATTDIFIADDAIHPRELTVLDAESATGFGPGIRIDELYLQAADHSPARADPTAQDFAAIFPWSRSPEHESSDPLQCYSFGWDHVVIKRASVPQLDIVIDNHLNASSPERFVDVTDEMSVQQRAGHFRTGNGNRVDLSGDRMTVHLRYPAVERRLVRYLPGPTIPWQGPWQPPAARESPFDFPWNPHFCMSDGACFQLAAAPGARGTTRRYVVDRQTAVIHRLHLVREPFWSVSFGTELRNTHCPFS